MSPFGVKGMNLVTSGVNSLQMSNLNSSETGRNTNRSVSTVIFKLNFSIHIRTTNIKRKAHTITDHAFW